IGVNAVILGCWRIQGLRRFMETWFRHCAIPQPRPLTLLTACFSHSYVLAHFLPNMASLMVYFGPVKQALGLHQATAVYLSAGIMGFASSHVIRLVCYHHFRQELKPSLGASGSVMGIMAVTYTCYYHQTHQEMMGVGK
ncbi:hypothetical protein BDA99DRAFT_436151, partial [Phascolomyces articulosus]